MEGLIVAVTVPLFLIGCAFGYWVLPKAVEILLSFTPVNAYNLPEAAILGVGRIHEQIVRGAQGLLWRQMMTLSLTVDHRLIDGAPGAAFLQRVCQLLAAPEALGSA